MRKRNKHEFEKLPENQFFKSTEIAAQHFRTIKNFPNSLGFDEFSFGFIALHRGHADMALNEELPVCIILKMLGHAVILADETSETLAFDAFLDEKAFEIKRISRASNLKESIVRTFRHAYRKAENLLLHIDQAGSLETVRNGIFAAAQRYPKIKTVWLVWGGQFFQLQRTEILRGRHLLK